MKVKLLSVFRARDAMQKLIEAQLPAKNAFRVARFAKSFLDVLNDIEKQRTKLVEKYGQKDDKGISVQADKMEAFLKEFNEMLDQEVELKEAALSLATLEGLSYSASEISLLVDFVEE